MNDAAWRWRTVEHTADLAMELEAPSLEELFLAAAGGMVGVLVGSEEGRRVEPSTAVSQRRTLELEAPDREALLVEWLRELLYLHTAEDLFYRGAEIQRLGDTRLVAQVSFAAQSGVGAVERELKGVTYHDLEVSRRDNGWYARVVFDL